MANPKQPTKAQRQRAAVTEAVLAAGFIPAGTTDTETVRIPTQASPVYGATGGELRTMGGRARYTKPGTNVRVTVGQQTTNVYRVVNGRTEFIANLNTRDIEPERFTLDLLTWTGEPTEKHQDAKRNSWACSWCGASNTADLCACGMRREHNDLQPDDLAEIDDPPSRPRP